MAKPDRETLLRNRERMNARAKQPAGEGEMPPDPPPMMSKDPGMSAEPPQIPGEELVSRGAPPNPSIPEVTIVGRVPPKEPMAMRQAPDPRAQGEAMLAASRGAAQAPRTALPPPATPEEQSVFDFLRKVYK